MATVARGFMLLVKFESKLGTSNEKNSVAEPTTIPAVTRIRKVLMEPDDTRQGILVSLNQSVASHAVRPTRLTAVRALVKKFFPDIVALAAPVVAILILC